jgi:hypothetical protein
VRRVVSREVFSEPSTTAGRERWGIKIYSGNRDDEAILWVGHNNLGGHSSINTASRIWSLARWPQGDIFECRVTPLLSSWHFGDWSTKFSRYSGKASQPPGTYRTSLSNRSQC